jgi:hypothetical protein
MEQFLEDPGLAARMGRSARARAEREFDSVKVNARMVAALVG